MIRRGSSFPLQAWVERTWRGEGGGLSFLLLRPLEALYRLGSAISRRRRARTRRAMPGMTVIAIGGITVGGSGKTTLARWAARAALDAGRHPAILLRGYGATGSSRGPQLVPIDARANHAALLRYGDEALAHRGSLPASILIVTGKDRWQAARLAFESGADLAILDDGWEQGTLAWDHLWVAVDPLRPFGNGRLLPAGPLRRPPHDLREADEIVPILDTKGQETGAGTVNAAGRARPPIRFLRIVEGWSQLHDGRYAALVSEPPPKPSIFLSSVGTPERLERFLGANSVGPSLHLAFLDHAPWDAPAIAKSMAELRERTGAEPIVMATDKDGARIEELPDLGCECWIVRSGLTPIDDPTPLLATLRARPAGRTVAARAPIG